MAQFYGMSLAEWHVLENIRALCGHSSSFLLVSWSRDTGIVSVKPPAEHEDGQ